MALDKNTKEIIKFVRKMQATERYKSSTWKPTKSKDVKIDNR